MAPAVKPCPGLQLKHSRALTRLWYWPAGQGAGGLESWPSPRPIAPRGRSVYEPPVFPGSDHAIPAPRGGDWCVSCELCGLRGAPTAGALSAQDTGRGPGAGPGSHC